MTVIHEDPSIPPLLALPQSFVIDPALADTVEMDIDLVSVAQPTAGPNRYTIHVPTEVTRLSLGALSGRWNTDKGITGYTNSHVHFETKAGSRTVMSLGGPATKSTLSGLGGKAPVGSNGYSMVTTKNAWHDAQKQHYLLSRTADVTFRTMGAGKCVVVQAVEGIVDITGGKEVNLAGGGVSIGARAKMEFEDVKYEESWHGETPHSLAAKRSAKFTTISATALTAHSLASTGVALRKRYKKGKLHASVDHFADVAEWLIDLAEFVRAKGEIAELFAAEEAVENSIKMDAEVDFGISAGGNASIFGIQGATLMSAVWASVGAVVSAGLKGSLFAGVAGAYTSLKGYKKIELGCDLGDTLIDAKKNVAISAENSFIAVGKELAKVVGEKNAYFSSGDNAWLGVAAGGGWGLRFNAEGVMIGKANSPKTMKSATIDPDRSIKIEKSSFTLKSASTIMTIGKNSVEAKSASVKFHAKDSDVRVAGKKVLIDGP
ncbi:MAG: hypothetical protein ABJE95_13850 [Byssovorax sp.]